MQTLFSENTARIAVGYLWLQYTYGVLNTAEAFLWILIMTKRHLHMKQPMFHIMYLTLENWNDSFFPYSVNKTIKQINSEIQRLANSHFGNLLQTLIKKYTSFSYIY